MNEGACISESLQVGHIDDHETFGCPLDDALFLEPAHDSGRRLDGESGHIGQVFAGQTDGKTNAGRFRDAGFLRQQEEDRGDALFRVIKRKCLRMFLGLFQPRTQVLNDRESGIRISAQEIEIGLFLDPQDLCLVEDFGAAGMG